MRGLWWHFAARYLQSDHRVPYEVAGEPDAGEGIEAYQPLCGSCNRARSWSCEQCENWLNKRDSSLCMTCYWGAPERYHHIALTPARRLDLLWAGAETDDFEALRTQAEAGGIPIAELAKRLLKGRC